MELPRAGESGELEIIEPLCAVFRRKLKSEGLKYTPERAQVLDTIIQLDGLFEAERLMDDLKDAGFRVSKATVYRTIKLLLEAGILQRVAIDSEHARYQLVYGRRPQVLLIRVDTDEVEPVDMPELAAAIERLCRERGLQARGHRVHVFAESKQ
ncbi:MAG: transcriptional repressor [Phycisphaerales bacterium]|nr:MAG: transcriptional repressor [Phycisphaerales bacterium]